MAGRTFHLFPHLIPELRNEIWAHIAGKDIERVIVVRFDSDRFMEPDGTLDWNFSCTSPTILPITFQVNQESRHESFRIFRNTLQFDNGQKIYFNGIHDRIFLDPFSIYSMYMFSTLRHKLETGEPMPYLVEQFKSGIEVGFADIKKLAVTFSRKDRGTQARALHALRRKGSVLAGVTGPAVQKVDIPGTVGSWERMETRLRFMYARIINCFSLPLYAILSADWPFEPFQSQPAEEAMRAQILDGLCRDAQYVLDIEVAIAKVRLNN